MPIHRGRGRIFAGRELAFALVLAVTGCGKGTYPVEGQVLWQDGTPASELAGGSVIFEKTDAPLSATGELMPDGKFRLTTNRPGDGAPAGHYRVFFTEPMPQDSDRVPPPKMDVKFRNHDTSGLEFNVEKTRNKADFKIDRAGKSRR